MQEQLDQIQGDFELVATDSAPHLYMIGNDAIGLGAISAGSRFMAAYPITPASEIMEYMIANLPKAGGLLYRLKMKSQLPQWLLVQIMLV